MQEKIKLLIELQDFASQSKNPFLSAHKNKWKLKKTEREFVQVFRAFPRDKHFNENHAIGEIIDSLCDDSKWGRRLVSNLIDKKVLIEKKSYQTPDNESLIRKLLEGIGYVFLVETTGCGSSWGFTSIDGVCFEQEKNCVIRNLYFRQDEDCVFSIRLNTESSSLSFNQFFFTDKMSVHGTSQTHPDTNLVKNIFASPHEREYYTELLTSYPRSIILPNYPIRFFIDLTGNEIKKLFSLEQIEYLQKAYVDFVVADRDGVANAVFELQIGKHHNDKKYTRRDNIKKKLFESLGIAFKEEFGSFHPDFVS